jgi:hypothetical protein
MQEMRRYKDQLTNKNLSDYKVWEYHKSDDIEDGLIIKPIVSEDNNLKKRLESAEVFETFYVQTAFISRSKREFYGYCKITNHTSRFLLQAFEPHIIHEDRHIKFWYGMHWPSKSELEEIYMHLRIDHSNLFPLKMTIIPDVFHIDKTGFIDGFFGLSEHLERKQIKLY